MKRLILLLLFVFINNVAHAQAAVSLPVPIAYVLTSTLLAALVSAGVSALVTLKLKDKEYKNEYYKKVIDKRVKAVEAVDKISSLFSSVYYLDESQIGENMFFAVFLDEDFKKILDDCVVSHSQQIMWISNDLNDATNELVSNLLRIELKRDKISDETEKEEYLVSEHEQLSRRVDKVYQYISKEMLDLYDIRRFLKIHAASDVSTKKNLFKRAFSTAGNKN